jgi:Fe-S cluster assembly protein SufD
MVTMPTFSLPVWLQDKQSFALRQAETVGLPLKSDESWRYTRANQLLKHEYVSAATDQNYTVPKEVSDLIGENVDAVLYFYNGELLAKESKILRGENLVVAALSNVLMSAGRVQEHAKKMIETDSPSANLKAFGWQNNARFKEGAYIKSQSGESVTRSVALVYLYGNQLHQQTQQPFAVYPKNTISIEENASLDVIEIHLAVNSIDYLANTSTDLRVGEGATVNYAQVFWSGEETTLISDVKAVLNASAKLSSLQIVRGGAAGRFESSATLAGENAMTGLYSLIIADGKTHVDQSSSVHHQVGHTKSEQLSKNILKDNARVIFSGKLKIDQDAQKSDASQYNHNLLLSDGAEANTRPQLEVLADDVKAAHGATVGQLQPDEIFYLQSRGIDKAEAQRLLALGFQNDVLQKTPSEFIRNICDKIISRGQS